MESERIAIVDMGSRWIRAGFASEQVPRCQFPSLKLAAYNRKDFPAGKKWYTGWEADELSHTFVDVPRQTWHPIDRGWLSTGWEDAEDMLHHTFHGELKVDYKDLAAVVMTEHSLGDSRHDWAQILFETLGIPAVYFAPRAVLAAHATGRKTALVIDSGATVTYVVPVQEGEVLEKAVEASVGSKSGFKLIREVHGGEGLLPLRYAQDIKDRYGYTASNFNLEMERYGIPLWSRR